MKDGFGVAMVVPRPPGIGEITPPPKVPVSWKRTNESRNDQSDAEAIALQVFKSHPDLHHARVALAQNLADVKVVRREVTPPRLTRWMTLKKFVD
jgi:hypothetical protein